MRACSAHMPVSEAGQAGHGLTQLYSALGSRLRGKPVLRYKQAVSYIVGVKAAAVLGLPLALQHVPHA